MNNSKKALVRIIIILVLAVVVWFLFGKGGKGMFSAGVKTGDTVAVDYVGTFEDGKVFDTSLEQVAKDNALYSPQRSYAPLTFTVGSGQMIPGFEQAVMGMKVGDNKKVTLSPKDAYGEVREDLIVAVSGAQFKEAGLNPEVGQTYATAQGVNATVRALSGDMVIMDYNSPMAGKTLVFDITLKEIK